jgi:hypothetical protein
LIADGDPHDIMALPALRDIYLGLDAELAA